MQTFVQDSYHLFDTNNMLTIFLWDALRYQQADQRRNWHNNDLLGTAVLNIDVGEVICYIQN